VKRHKCILEGWRSLPFEAALLAVCLETGIDSLLAAYEHTGHPQGFAVAAVERLNERCKARHEVEGG
jgi:hypothetical protein